MERHHDAISRTLALLADVCAYQPKARGARVCAGVVYRRKLIAIGANLAKSDPWQHRFSSAPDRIYLHAEIAAIKKAYGLIGRDELSKCQLFVCRLKQIDAERGPVRRFQWALSKPCRGCSRAIDAFGIRRVYYTIDIGTYGTWDPWSPYGTHTIDPHVAAKMTQIVATL